MFFYVNLTKKKKKPKSPSNQTLSASDVLFLRNSYKLIRKYFINQYIIDLYDFIGDFILKP